MLKNLLTSLALIIGISNHSIAGELIKFPTELTCGGEDQFNAVLDKYEELPFATMSSTREIPGVGFKINPVVIFVNPKTKTYTMIERLSEEVYCIVSVGDGITPYTKEK